MTLMFPTSLTTSPAISSHTRQQLPLSFMSSLFGMNAVELTGSDPSPGAGDDSRPVPDEIETFWPITFKRQILIMCKSAPCHVRGRRPWERPRKEEGRNRTSIEERHLTQSHAM